MQHDLHTSQDTVTWVLTAYLLSASIFTPVLGRIGDMMGKKRVFVITLNIALRGPAAEVAQIHVIPLADLDRPPQLLAIAESERPVLRLPLLTGFVYAPTAAIIHQFCQLARHGLTTRVAQFDQPVFAWR